MSNRHIVIDLENEAKPIGKLSFNARRRIRESQKAVDALWENRVVKAEQAKSVSFPANEIKMSIPDEKPDCEWWDELLLENPELVTHLVEHPVSLKGTKGNISSVEVLKKEAMLTPAERMKLRKLKRREKVRDMQDKVKMGILKPPPPKVRMKNLMLVLGKEAVSGPSLIEQSVKAQVAQRLQDHQDRNEARKLTPEERQQKNISKWTKNIGEKLEVSVYLIFKKVHGKNKFKISKNAQQLHLGGFFIQSFIPSDEGRYHPSLVVVEGSHKAVKRFDRLMLSRIDWKESSEETAPTDNTNDVLPDESSSDDDDSLNQQSVCKRIFKGIDSANKKFNNKWSFLAARDVQSVHAFLQDRNSMHYWDTLLRYRDTKLDI